MTKTARRPVMRWPLALGLAMSACGLLHAADSDGDSGFDGAFVTLSGDIVHDHLAFRSFKVTPATRAAFVEACTHGKRIWINGRSAPCLSAEAVENGSAVQLEVPQDASLSSSATYFVVSAQSAANTALRELNDQERDSMSGDVGTAAIVSTGVHFTEADLGHAKAVNGKERALVFVTHGKDRNGNRLTYVFSVAAGQVAYTGKLPDWPEKLMNIGGALQAIVNLQGEARIVKVFSTWPHVQAQMFAGEGG
jgi:hypothetical protein